MTLEIIHTTGIVLIESSAIATVQLDSRTVVIQFKHYQFTQVLTFDSGSLAEKAYRGIKESLGKFSPH